MSEELWDNYREDSDDDQDSSSSEEPPAAGGSARRQPKRRGSDAYALEDMLPSSKRAKLRKRYGNLDGKFLDLDGDGSGDAGKKAAAAAADSDSDLEILRETAAAEEEKAALARRAAAAAAAANPSRPGSAQAEEWQNRQLLARVRARMQQADAPADDDDDGSDCVEEMDSPAPRLAARAAAAAAAAADDREPSQTPSEPSSGNHKGTIIIRFKDKMDNELRMRVNRGAGLGRAMDACRKTVAEKGWAGPGGPATCSFIFEGDPLRPDSTPDSLDLDDEEVIEVHYH